jgi:selenocysteine-specific elongation factor
MRVIGTAGHVDHGKSTLVQALTGTHPDRLKEEREREMTIDLGFAWMTLPKGEEVGIVDVPGHRDFIENMLAGIGGIDAVLFVIAADEGIMPQTREHLAILDILQIQGGVIALTKIDLVDDSEWLDLIEDEIQQVFRSTILEHAPILRVSARSGQGIPELIQAISDCLDEQPSRPDLGRPRLPVDRVFKIAGFGTVVTGTLMDGQLKIGEEVQVLPGSFHCRIRGLQSHKRKEELAVPGSRTAINLSGVNVDQIKRGDVIARPGSYQPSRRVDVQFRLLPDINQPLKHNTEVKFFVGATEVVARIRLLGTEELLPGDQGWLQLEFDQPVVVVRGDHYILRRPSPGETLGGGKVVDPHPKGRHKRFANAVLQGLESLALGTPQEIITQAMLALGAAAQDEVYKRSNLDRVSAQSAFEALLARGEAIVIDENLVIHRSTWNLLVERLIGEVQAYHRANPLRRGMLREELKSRTANGTANGLRLTPRLFNAALRILIAQKDLVENGPLLYYPDHQIRFTPQQQRQVDELLSHFSASPFAPPTVKECVAAIGENLYSALVELDQLVPVPPDVVFRRQDYDRMVREIKQLIGTRGAITAAEVRDHFNTSRRYVLAFLEHLDALGITIREGDTRRLK